MNKLLFIFICTIFFNNITLAEEVSCKKFDLLCKTKNAIKNTAEFQKKGVKDSKDQLGSSTEKMKKLKLPR